MKNDPALNWQEKQDFLVGVEKKFIFHILFQTLVIFWGGDYVCVLVTAVLSRGLALGAMTQHKATNMAVTKPLPAAAFVRRDSGRCHSRLSEFGRLSQICGWNVGKHNYACLRFVLTTSARTEMRKLE